MTIQELINEIIKDIEEQSCSFLSEREKLIVASTVRMTIELKEQINSTTEN